MDKYDDESIGGERKGLPKMVTYLFYFTEWSSILCISLYLHLSYLLLSPVK